MKALDFSNTNNRKDISIETIRGIAVILMVAAHVIGSSSSAGIRVEDDSFWRYLYKSLVFIRMPLFTAISGYVYALRPVDTTCNVSNFIGGKVRRLLLPLITIATFQYVFQSFVPGVNKPVGLQNIWQIYVYPYNQFWFLQAIFIIFILITVVDYYNLISTLLKWVLFLSLTCISFLFLYLTDFLNLSNAIYLLPFFVLGLGIKRFEEKLFQNKILIITMLMVLIIGITIQQGSYFSDFGVNFNRKSLLGLIVGLSSTFMIIKFRFKNNFLAFIGFYSYGIFLLHIFGTASSRIIMGVFHLHTNKTLLFFICLSFGIIVPIVIQYFIYKSNLLKTLLLGLKYKKTVLVPIYVPKA